MRLRTLNHFVYNKGTMKKRSLFYIALFVSPILLSSCNSSKEKVKLTYGNYATQTISSLTELGTEDLYNRLLVEEEVLILATYNDSSSEDCLCWSTFQNVIVNFINKYHEQVYVYSTKNADDSLRELKLNNTDNSKPGLRIYKGKKKVAQFYYSNINDQKIFEDTTAEYMYSKLHDYIEKPSLYYVDKTYLDNKIAAKNDDFAVLFMRNGCGDCKYVIPNVIIPYINKNELKKDVLLFDIQSYYDLAKNESATEEEKAQYQTLKDTYYLSETASDKFGYEKGVVPTMQYYDKGVLKDASVYFNDSIEQKEDGSFYVSKSYYTEERLPNLSYLKDANVTKVLQGMTIETKYAMQTKSGSYYWLQADAANYHTPLLKAFLDYYLL